MLSKSRADELDDATITVEGKYFVNITWSRKTFL